MKTFLLIITILLFMQRISSTPRSLSKKAYRKYIEKETESLSNIFAKKTESEVDGIKFATSIVTFIIYLFMFWFYIHIAGRFNNEILYAFSIVQATTVIVSGWKMITSNPFSTSVDDHPFYRWYFMFNTILDYMYYPFVIYMLLS